MIFDSLTPLPVPALPGRGAAVRVGADQPARPATQELNEALRTFSARFTELEKGQDGPALVVTTSGSTGTPKQTVLPASALAASARGTEAATNTHDAQWLLALPLQYVAGAQVVARSALAGTKPVITTSVSEGSRFTAQDFITSTEKLSTQHRLVSLVPTQLHRLLETPTGPLRSETLEALRSFSAILLGGAPASADLISTARDLALPVVRTYGSAETAGGCVYEGKPLPGVRVQIEPEATGPEAPGRIWLGGPTIASGYTKDPQRTAAHFFIDDNGTRWYRTDDLGTFGPSTGSLTVTGRADDVLISGGIKTSAAAVATALESHPDVREALVAGVPDARWGTTITAAITPVAGRNIQPGELTDALPRLVAEKLGAASAPKLIEVLPEFPTLPTGKPDRRAVQALLTAAWQAQQGSRGTSRGS
ncbi:MAG: AMP-binding protein [Rothia sp. (in: high G+C Gram-positive bacteria)]|uniref:AMP-binding protein n=1 Tax=Rothia sp. (in: high G+C Gram-positive bacteria) TaxID=1885016 RepID=UPI002710CFF0|nr:AMP-binding protein [Rothia sp. (in: high G+C Gram-positive bacteria)]